MRARSHLSVGLDDRGWSTPTTLLAEAPLLLRVTDRSAEALAVHLVGGAAGPLGGDHLDLAVDVGDGARLTIRSVAASLVQPGPSCGSLATVRVSAGRGSHLDWWPQPLLSIAGSNHTIQTTIDIDAGATLRWVDEVVLGRAGEPSGTLTLEQRLCVGGHPLLNHRTTFGPQRLRRATDPVGGNPVSGNPVGGNRGAGRHGNARVIVTAIVVGQPALASQSIVTSSVQAARFALSPTATNWIVLGDDLDEVHRTMTDLLLSASVSNE